METADLLIKVRVVKQPRNFPVKITLHKTLNTIQGRIFSIKIIVYYIYIYIYILQEELLDALKEQKVVDTHKMMITFDLR